MTDYSFEFNYEVNDGKIAISKESLQSWANHCEVDDDLISEKTIPLYLISLIEESENGV